MTDAEKIDMLVREVADLKQMVMGISQMCNVLISMGNRTYVSNSFGSSPSSQNPYLHNLLGTGQIR